MTDLAFPLLPNFGTSKPIAGYYVQRGSGITKGHPVADNFDDPLNDVLKSTRALLSWPENWNGHEVDAPNPAAVSYALPWLTDMYNDATSKTGHWISPIVTADEDGDVAFEWWNEERGLFVYIAPEEINYIIHWGENIDTQMDMGNAADREMRIHLWSWLLKLI